MTPQEVENVVVEVVRDICNERGIESLTLDCDTILIGSEALVDSVGLVTIVMEIEERLSEDFAVEVSLTSDKAMSRERSPLRTIGSIRDYVVEQAVDSAQG